MADPRDALQHFGSDLTELVTVLIVPPEQLHSNKTMPVYLCIQRISRLKAWETLLVKNLFLVANTNSNLT